MFAVRTTFKLLQTYIHPIVPANTTTSRSYSPKPLYQVLIKGGRKRRNSKSDKNAGSIIVRHESMNGKSSVALLVLPPLDFCAHQAFQEHRPLAIGAIGSHRWMYDVERQLREDNIKLASANSNNTSPIANTTFIHPSDSNIKYSMPFQGFQALTGNQYFKPLPSNINAYLPEKIPSFITRNASFNSVSQARSSMSSPASASEMLNPEQLIDILLSGSPFSELDTVTKQLAHKQVILARIQAEVYNIASEALAKIELKRCRSGSSKILVSISGRRPALQAISLIKRRRKKMNKHKFEQREKRNKRSIRANKEALRKKGHNRQKQV